MFIVALIAVALVLWIIWRKKSFSLFKELGIPGPEPSALFGNLQEIYRTDPIQCMGEWLKKYGKVVGYYYGTQPAVLISDLDLLKKIQVSDFHKFMNRPILIKHAACGLDSDRSTDTSTRVTTKSNYFQNMFRTQDSKKKPVRVEGFSQQLVQLKDKRWKEIRSLLTPSFTTSKMKQMTPIINDAINSLINNVESKSAKGESFDIYPMYQALTMDVIGRTAFGIQTDVQNNPDDPLLNSARMLIGSGSRSTLSLIAASFRKLGRFWSWIFRLILTSSNKGVNPFAELVKSVRAVIEQRRKDKESRRPDLLQLMIDAEGDVSDVNSDDLTATDDDTTEKKSERPTSGKLVKKMTDDDILDNSVLFFLAGYETTSTALGFTTHLLVHHEDVQEKVRREVLELLEKEGEFDYYSVNKLQYLDQVLHEGLRLYPPVYMFIHRECAEDVDFGTFKLKKGLAVQVPVFNMHRDPELWEDPDKFIPERFAPENKSKYNPLAYQPFGAGPRNCVGMRFALMEAKLALSKLLAKYKLKPCAETDKEAITLNIKAAGISPKNGVYLKAVPVL